MSLFINLTQDLSWLFAVMLQHDQRYLLAEAVYFLLAFFLTLSDHRRGIAKASKVPCDAYFPRVASLSWLILLKEKFFFSFLFLFFSFFRTIAKRFLMYVGL